MASSIKWQTGLPEQSGLYLVTMSTGEVTVMEWYNPYTSSPYWLEEEGEIVAWCDFKDVEPYKEETMEEKGTLEQKYPKNYEECCKVLLLKPERATYSVSGLEYERHLIVNLQRLLICRNAYWKLAGEEMGLGKPWKPYIGKASYQKYVIQTVYDNITCLDTSCQTRNILEFPTPEMRDAFHENFLKLIEACRELL